MRKLLAGAAALLLLGAGSLPARADFDPARWPCRLQAAAIPAGERGEAVVPEAVYRRCGTDLKGLRLLGGGAREIPYVIVSRAPVVRTEPVAATVFNKTRDHGRILFELDLGVQRRFHNQVTIDLTGQDFRFPVTIQGSRDQLRWETLRENASILRFLADRQVEATTVRYGDADYRFLRITVGPTVPAEVVLNRVEVNRLIEEPGDMAERTVVASTLAVETNAGDRTSVCTLDLGSAGFPHQQVTLATEAAAFSREVVISGRNSEAEPWRELGSGSIYRYRTETGATVAYPEATTRYLKVAVRDYDDQPLPLTGVTVRGVNRRLLFPLATPPEYLYYGNDESRPPRYDFARQWEVAGSPGSGVPVRFGAEEPNPAFQPRQQPYPESHPGLIYLGLGLGVLVFGFIAVRLLKPPAGPPAIR